MPRPTAPGSSSWLAADRAQSPARARRDSDLPAAETKRRRTPGRAHEACGSEFATRYKASRTQPYWVSWPPGSPRARRRGSIGRAMRTRPPGEQRCWTSRTPRDLSVRLPELLWAEAELLDPAPDGGPVLAELA